MATEDDAACIICLKTEDELLNLGPKIQKGNITVHFYCLKYSPVLRQGRTNKTGIEGFRFQDIFGEAKRASTIKCGMCRQYGANIGCCRILKDSKKCRRAFHVLCGTRRGATFLHTSTTCPSFCWEHSDYNIQPFDNKIKSLRKSRSCNELNAINNGEIDDMIAIEGQELLDEATGGAYEEEWLDEDFQNVAQAKNLLSSISLDDSSNEVTSSSHIETPKSNENLSNKPDEADDRHAAELSHKDDLKIVLDCKEMWSDEEN